MRRTAAAIWAVLASSAHATKVLSPTSWDIITAGKEKVWVKFMSPGCMVCKIYTKGWHEVSTDYLDTAGVGIYDVDCTQSPQLCQEFDFQRYPSFFFGDPSNRTAMTEWTHDKTSNTAHKYEGLSSAAVALLGLPCSPASLGSCDEAARATLESFLEAKMPAELEDIAAGLDAGFSERRAELEKKGKDMAEASADFDERFGVLTEEKDKARKEMQDAETEEDKKDAKKRYSELAKRSQPFYTEGAAKHAREKEYIAEVEAFEAEVTRSGSRLARAAKKEFESKLKHDEL